MAYVKPSFIPADKMNYLPNVGRRVQRSPTVEEAHVGNSSKNIRNEILEKNALLLAQPDPQFYPGLFHPNPTSRWPRGRATLT